MSKNRGKTQHKKIGVKTHGQSHYFVQKLTSLEGLNKLG